MAINGYIQGRRHEREEVITIIAKLLDTMIEERGGMPNRINVIDFVYRLNKEIKYNIKVE